MPIPIQYAMPQGRSHDFVSAQNNQTPTQLDSFFVYRISDYQLVTIANELMEATKGNAAAFVDAAKLQIEGGFRNITNNIASELFGSGTATRGISSASSSQAGVTASGTVLPLSNPQDIVKFEVGMLLVASATDGGAPSTDTVLITKVDRTSGVIRGTASAVTLSANWNIGAGLAYLTQQGDLPSTGAVSTGSFRALSGLLAWLPLSSPGLSDSFWGVNRSADPTRLAGVRYDASAFTIEEGLTNALALVAREGGRPDMIIMSFESYAALVNSLGAKVQYVQVKHDEVDVSFEGITFVSAYGRVTVLADRSCPARVAFILTRSTWKLRSVGKIPHVLRYGMEGLEGIRVANADALEIRIGYYGNLTCSAPAWNCVVQLSA